MGEEMVAPGAPIPACVAVVNVLWNEALLDAVGHVRMPGLVQMEVAGPGDVVGVPGKDRGCLFGPDGCFAHVADQRSVRPVELAILPVCMVETVVVVVRIK